MTSLASSPGARLSVTDRLGRRVVLIDTSPFTIGRGADSVLAVAGSEVSREHAEIVTEGDRHLLRDRGSRYGTFVNGEPKTEHVLVDGDRIRLGRSAVVELVFLDQPNDLAAGGSLVGLVRQTAALLDGLRALGGAHLLQDVLVLVLDAAIEVSGADRGFIMLATAEATLEFTLARGRGHVTLSGDTFQTSRKIPDEVFATGQTCSVGDLIEGDVALNHSATIALGIRHVLCVPLRLVRYVDQPGVVPEPKRLGVLYLDGRERGSLLSPSMRMGVETLATEAAVAIESARLYREMIEKARVDRELVIASEMQRALRPASRFRGSDFEIAGASQPSRSIGGDFFDYGALLGGGFGLALGDVAGKGPPAAVLAAALQGMLVASVAGEVGPGDTLSRVNRILVQHFVTERFATLIYGVLQPGGRLTYSVAGHNPPMLFRGTAVRRLETGGVPLGLFLDAVFPQEVVQLETGDVLVFFSDGVSEAADRAGEPFGDERIITSVLSSLEADVDTLLSRLIEDVRRYSGHDVPDDDVSALVLRFLGGEAPQ